VALTLPNLDKISSQDQKLGEALQAAQSYIRQNVVQVVGNKKIPPTFVTPARRAG
jgi:hypothetical protein